jgi:hypothetical protein
MAAWVPHLLAFALQIAVASNTLFKTTKWDFDGDLASYGCYHQHPVGPLRSSASRFARCVVQNHSTALERSMTAASVGADEPADSLLLRPDDLVVPCHTDVLPPGERLEQMQPICFLNLPPPHDVVVPHLR